MIHEEEHDVYRWTDGSMIRMSISPVRKRFLVETMFGDRKFEFQHDGKVLDPDFNGGPYDEETARKMRGFLLDVWDGTPRFWTAPPSHIVRSSPTSSPLMLPQWIPDEEREGWIDRATLRPSAVEAVGPLTRFSTRRTHQGWHLEWKRDGRVNRKGIVHKTDSFSSDSFRIAMEEALRSEHLLPESEKERWMASNVEPGTWVLPDPEEVNLLRMLGEPNPLLLPIDKLRLWLQGRQP